MTVRFLFHIPLLLLLALAAGAPALAQFVQPRVWVDTATGFAIGGFDPVDYYIRSEASRPAPHRAVELVYGGVVWRFRNEGNAAAFRLHPRIYMPRFGGFDPVKVASGLVVAGRPALFEIHKNRLYLFFDRASLTAWRKDRARLLAQAIDNWPRVAEQAGVDASEPAGVKPCEEKSGLMSPAAPICEPARWSGHPARR